MSKSNPSPWAIIALLPIVFLFCVTTKMLSLLPKEISSGENPLGYNNPLDFKDSNVDGDNSSLFLLPVRFHLKQRNLDWLEQRLYEIADPSRADYGQWMALEELADWIAPSEMALNQLVNWVSSVTTHDDHQQDDTLISISPTKDSVSVHWNVHIVERAFGIKLGSAQSSSNASPQSMPIPHELSPFVELITGTVSTGDNLSTRRRKKKSGSSFRSEFQGRDITPEVIYETYNLNMMTGLEDDKILASQTAAEFEEAYFYPHDVLRFEEQNDLPEQNVSRILGKNTPDDGYLGEASLDVQYLIAAAPRVPTWVISLYEFDLASWVEEILKHGNDAPRVHSVSWGSAEMDHDVDWVYRMNNELMKLALLGHSILVASGDEGAGNAGLGILCKRFQPVFPATSPFVTAVGGTYLDEKTNKEMGWKYSGGGFSDRFSRPDYQREAVEQYFQKLEADGMVPPSNMYNQTGRAVPDVSALATNYQVVIENSTGPMSGTSASTPTFAGFVSRLNQQRLKAGRPVLGFLNPLLYKLKGSSGFHDITDGNNKLRPCRTGWSASVGWDAITGLGTPNVEELLKITEME